MRTSTLLMTLALLLAPVLAACAVDRQTVVARAANDLDCSREDLAVSNVGNHSYEVSGCGSSATYTCVNDSNQPAGTSTEWSCIKEK